MPETRQLEGRHVPEARSRIRFAVLLLLAGCSIVDPIHLPDRERSRIFALPASSADPGGKPADPSCEGMGTFAGGLGMAICDVDERRLQLNKLGAEVINGTATYNALLWPIGSAVLYEKLRNSNHSLLLPAAVATAAYGFISSGVSDRDRHYVLTGRRLACEIVDASVDLYKTADLTTASDTTETTDSLRRPGLYTALNTLRTQIKTFREKRDEKLSALTVERAKSGAGSKLFLDLKRGLGRGATDGPPKDSRQKILDATQALLDQARATQKSGEEMRTRIADSGMRLRARWASVESSAQEQLSARVPAPVDPKVIGKQVIDSMNAFVTAQAKEAQPGINIDAMFDATWLDGLDKDSRANVKEFRISTKALRQAIDDVQGWLDDDGARRVRVDATLTALSCKANDLAVVAVPVLVPASGGAGAKPTTPLTPSVTTLPAR